MRSVAPSSLTRTSPILFTVLSKTRVLCPGRSHQLESPAAPDGTSGLAMTRYLDHSITCRICPPHLPAACSDHWILEERPFRDDARVEIAPQINDQVPSDGHNPDFPSHRPTAGKPLGIPLC